MAEIIQEGLEIKGKHSIQVNKGGSKIICLSNREDSIPVGVGAYGNSEFSWIQEPVTLSWDVTSGLRQLLLTPRFLWSLCPGREAGKLLHAILD